MKRRIIPQHDFRWDQPEAFTLVVERAEDGQRIERERAQSEHDRKLAEQNQTCFPLALPQTAE